MSWRGTNIPKRRRRRIIAIGDLNSKIKLQTRTINTQFQSGSDDDADFVTVAEPWALIETVRGSSYLSGVEVERRWTHNIYLRYRSDVDQTFWVEYKGRRFNIDDVESLDERDEFLLLRCIETGLTDKSGATG